METPEHRKLKQLSLAFLREHGCVAAALEVQCPIGRYRADVAGYVDRDDGRGKGPQAPGDRGSRRPPRTVLIECKRSRSDFLRDRRDLDRLVRRRRDLDRIRAAMERNRIPVEEPGLRRAGSSLFPELEEWDFAASRLPAYRNLLRELRRVDRELHGQTKFFLAARYQLADRLYVAAPRGLIRPREVPPGWGLLECSPRALREADPNADLFGTSRLEIAVKAPEHAPREAFRQRTLRNIAVAASRAVSIEMGIRVTAPPA